MLIKAFRLFVSSTFKDFVQERTLLQSNVLPALDAYCAARGYQFHAVDLRWGVNDEAQLDQRTADICLSEVAVAKSYPPPNLLIMVGDRYGWVPLPFAIARDEFEAVNTCLRDHRRAEASRILGNLYRLDENNLVPPGLKVAASKSDLIGAYTLRSREDDIPEFASADAWHDVEDQARAALQAGADRLFQEGRISELARDKYFLSLTEQEIIEGLPNLASGGGNGASSSGHLNNDKSQCIAWIRIEQPSSFRRMASLIRRSPAEGSLFVQQVTSRIRQTLPIDAVLARPASRNWRGQLDAAYLQDFAARIESQLKDAVDRHIALVDAQERSTDGLLVRERAHHKAFAEERRNFFVGREDSRAMIESYIASKSGHPLVVSGRSGHGKSSLIAQAIADYEKTDRNRPIVYRFIGATAGSADVRSLLVSVIEDLAAHGIVARPDRWEHDAEKVDHQVRALFQSVDTPAVVFIDALDQLKKPYRLGWLPDHHRESFKIVVSTLNDNAYEDDSGVYRALRRRLPAEAFLEIGPLTQNQGRNILMALGESARHALQPGQRDYVLDRFEGAGASPLYLRIAFEITKAWKSWHKAGTGRHVLGGDTAALIGQLLAELSSVHHHEPELVSHTLGYLAAAKDGLSVKELTEVLSSDRGVMMSVSSESHGVRTHKLPDAVWVRLYRQLEPLLVEKSVDEQSLLQFFHRQLADIARKQHYEPARNALHRGLADYFDAGIWIVDQAGGKTYTKRSLSELPYQLFASGKADRLSELLCSLEWVRQKLRAFGGPYQLISDYQFAVDQKQAMVRRALELSANVLSWAPEQLGAQLRARLFPDAKAIFGDAIEPSLGEPTLSPTVPNLTHAQNPVLRTLVAHTQLVFKFVVGAVSEHLFSCSADRTIREWDWRTGELVATYGPYNDGLRSLAINSSETKLYGGLGVQWHDLFSKYSLVAWDVAGNSLHWNVGQDQPTSAIALHPSSDFAVSAGWDQRLHFWRPSDGTYVRDPIDAHMEGINTLVIDATRDVAFTGASDQRIRKWSLKDGSMLADVEASEDYVLVLALDGTGNRLASGDTLGNVRLWEAENVAPLVLCQADDVNYGEVNSISYSPDGSRIAAGYSNNLLVIFDSITGVQQCRRICGAPVMWVMFLDSHTLACAEGATIAILSFSTLQSDQREALRMQSGVEQISARLGHNEVLCIGGGYLDIRRASTLELIDQIPIGVRRFTIEGDNAILVCANSIMSMDLEQFQLHTAATLDVGSSECHRIAVIPDAIAVVVTWQSNTVRCDAVKLQGGRRMFAFSATWEDAGFDMFRLMAGIGFLEHAERRSHETGYVCCDVALDGTCVIYFATFQSVLLFNVRAGRERHLNYVNYYGAASERSVARARAGQEGGSLKGEYGLQRNGVIELAFCARSGRRSIAIAQPSKIEIVDCETDASVSVNLENETLTGLSRASDGNQIIALTTCGLRLLDVDEARILTLRNITGLSKLWAVNVSLALALCGAKFNSICVVRLDQTDIDRSYYLDAGISDVHVDWDARRLLIGCSDGCMHVLNWEVVA
jgi:WD40 repeat protein